ncbi:hypothetical protein EMIHUDRAFT_225420 [Emiliania huxleyi CCMP1516]|uniref:Sulfotransferase family protein n=2 Tax=Emiliania huxleyi TaxID=2903 RepID=A0A0D3KP52_EMIH1|nr:hypothetical protein EMIHUDRAFT_225420 [Emiliania huxleyi CCMP1516]EOD37537.1 hypothetical protein EMIHUDRAFT_225420 [Emiliania huxleyi CCMP1516]|eukprot:XP_005789966.1 hypothetical protein EMIHUDRAFT_225420 [Emiliania huxleyi CCMP1516]
MPIWGLSTESDFASPPPDGGKAGEPKRRRWRGRAGDRGKHDSHRPFTNRKAAPGVGAPEVIGAGCGRTGTTSLSMALERLGFGPCHSMAAVAKMVRERPWARALEEPERANTDFHR